MKHAVGFFKQSIVIKEHINETRVRIKKEREDMSFKKFR